MRQETLMKQAKKNIKIKPRLPLYKKSTNAPIWKMVSRNNSQQRITDSECDSDGLDHLDEDVDHESDSEYVVDDAKAKLWCKQQRGIVHKTARLWLKSAAEKHKQRTPQHWLGARVGVRKHSRTEEGM